MPDTYLYFSIQPKQLFGVITPENGIPGISVQYRSGTEIIMGPKHEIPGRIQPTLTVEVSGPKSFVYDLADQLEIRGIEVFHASEQLEQWHDISQ